MTCAYIKCTLNTVPVFWEDGNITRNGEEIYITIYYRYHGGLTKKQFIKMEYMLQRVHIQILE